MLNLPNLLTLSRIVAVPLLVALLWWPEWRLGYGLGFAMYCLMGLTDYFDGYVARSYGAVSKLGAFLDPIADKIMVAAVILVLAAQGVLRGPYVGDMHVIAGLVRKPGAFRRYRYRDALFPTQTFRLAYERLRADLSEWAADVEYLRIVHLAATTMQCDVEAALLGLLAAGTRPSLDLVRARVAPPPPPAPFLEAPVVNLKGYDSLIGTLEETFEERVA